MRPLLDIANLRAAVRNGRAAQPLLRGVSLRVQPGEAHGLVGESGAGKTLVAGAVLGVLPETVTLDDGSIRFQGRELLTLSAAARRRLNGRHIALIPQDPLTALNPVRRIGAQLGDVLRLHLKLSRAETRRRALALLAEVQLRDPERVYRRYPFELSGGMRQRVLIAAAFACEPALIIADEPTTALDVTVQKQILKLIRALQRRTGTALLFVSHDLGVVAKLCGRVSVMYAGRVLETGAAAELLGAPRHDYTRALLAATPRYDRPGEPPRPVDPALRGRLLAEAADDDRRFGRRV